MMSRHLTDDQDSAEIMRQQVKRQRLGLLLGAVCLAGLFVVYMAGYDPAGAIEEWKQGNASQPVDQSPAPQHNDSPNAPESDQDGTGDAAEPAIRWRRTQSVTCVAYPWREERIKTAGTLPEGSEARWLPELVDDIGMALCDFNNGLDRGNDDLAEKMLPFTGASFSHEECALVQIGCETQHLIVVDVSDASAWKVYGWTHADTLESAPQPTTIEAASMNFSALAGSITRMMAILTGIDVQNFIEVSIPANKAEEVATLEALIVDQKVDAALDMAASMRFENPGFVYPLVMLSRGLNDHSARYLHDMRAAVYHGVQHPRLVERYCAYITWSEPTPEDFIEARRLLGALLKSYPTFMPAWSQLDRMPRVVDGNLKYPVPEEQALEGIERFPDDGRYQAWLAADLCVQAHRVEDAISYAKQALELAPWRASAYYHSGMAKVQKARNLIRKGRDHYADARKLYDQALMDYFSGWQGNQNRLQLWVREIINAMTFGIADRAAERWPDRGSFVLPADRNYRKLLAALCLIEANLVGGTSKAAQNTLNWLAINESDVNYPALIREDSLKAREDVTFPNRYITLMAGSVVIMGEVGSKLTKEGVTRVLESIDACLNAGLSAQSLLDLRANLTSYLNSAPVEEKESDVSDK